MYQESEGGKARELTDAEKRRYIKILVTVLLALYIDQIKELSAQKKRDAEKRLYSKYGRIDKSQPLINMINKIAKKLE